ncbi:hypothetical protein Bca52824_016119 [Brassica carinata]|uniref:Uncharacterized protein n=1 Tax=Brassica carinata TaxID=52824 RepID=A0A8X7W3W9_BRACI|nr:hypothetical protein Bca52824_016119 [Brassica carinata]
MMHTLFLRTTLAWMTEDVTPDTIYDLEDIEDGFDDETYRRWMMDSSKKSSLMRRILKVITGGCFKGHQERGRVEQSSMTSRHTRRNAQGDLHSLTNEQLARLEKGSS